MNLADDRRILRGALAIGSARMAAVLISTVQVVIVVRRLSLTAYGMWAAASVVGISAFLVSAVGGNLITALASALASSDRKDADDCNRALFLAAFTVTACGCWLAAAGVLIVQRWLPWALLINTADPDLIGEARLGLVAAFAIQLLLLPFGLAPFVFRAYQENDIVGAYTVVGAVASLALVTMATFTSRPLLAAIVAPYTANLLINVGVFALLLRRREWSWPGFGPRKAWTLFRPHLGHVVWFAALGAAFAAIASSLTYVLSLSQGFAVAGVVDVYLKLFTVLLLVQGETIAPLWPAYTSRRIAGDWRWIRHRLLTSVAVSMAGVVAAAVVFSQAAAPIVRWLTKRDLRIDRGTFAALVLYTVFYATIQALSTFLSASGRLKTQVAANVTALVCMPILSLGLGRMYGTAGAVLACAVALGIVAAAMSVRAAVELAGHTGCEVRSWPAGVTPLPTPPRSVSPTP